MKERTMLLVVYLGYFFLCQIAADSSGPVLETIATDNSPALQTLLREGAKPISQSLPAARSYFRRGDRLVCMMAGHAVELDYKIGSPYLRADQSGEYLVVFDFPDTNGFDVFYCDQHQAIDFAPPFSVLFAEYNGQFLYCGGYLGNQILLSRIQGQSHTKLESRVEDVPLADQLARMPLFAIAEADQTITLFSSRSGTLSRLSVSLEILEQAALNLPTYLLSVDEGLAGTAIQLARLADQAKLATFYSQNGGQIVHALAKGFFKHGEGLYWLVYELLVLEKEPPSKLETHIPVVNAKLRNEIFCLDPAKGKIVLVERIDEEIQFAGRMGASLLWRHPSPDHRGQIENRPIPSRF